MIQGGLNSRDQAAWNINAEQSKFITELDRKAWNNYLQGDFDGWFWHLTAIREKINHDLTSGEIKKGRDGKMHHTTNESKELDDIEKKISIAKGSIIQAKKSGNKIKLIMARNNYISSIRIYSRRIGLLLKQLGYLPPKEDRTKLSF